MDPGFRRGDDGGFVLVVDRTYLLAAAAPMLDPRDRQAPERISSRQPKGGDPTMQGARGPLVVTFEPGEEGRRVVAAAVGGVTEIVYLGDVPRDGRAAVLG